MQNLSFFICEKIQQYHKCPALDLYPNEMPRRVQGCQELVTKKNPTTVFKHAKFWISPPPPHRKVLDRLAPPPLLVHGEDVQVGHVGVVVQVVHPVPHAGGTVLDGDVIDTLKIRQNSKCVPQNERKPTFSTF